MTVSLLVLYCLSDVSQRDMMMERGEVRVARNMALRLQTQQEMALGLTLGPHNSRHRYSITHDFDINLLNRKLTVQIGSSTRRQATGQMQ